MIAPEGAIHEYDAKLLLAYWLERAPAISKTATVSSNFIYPSPKVAQISWDPETGAITPDTQLPSWVFTSKLVAKPDQLIKRRGKSGLLLLNKEWEQAKEWIAARAGKEVQVESTKGTLKNFIVEPFLPHSSETEYYVCINSAREGDNILFTHEGGIEVGDVDAKALKLLIPVNQPFPTREEIKSCLLTHVPPEKQDTLVDFLIRLYSVYVDLHFAYLEINPLVCLDGANGNPPTIHYLDMAAKLDQTADFICGPKWAIARDLSVYDQAATAAAKKGAVGADRGPPMVWPAPFGRDLTREEAYIQKLDGSTGASLKLTVLNAGGRIWTMVAGGGASVVYSDANVGGACGDPLAASQNFEPLSYTNDYLSDKPLESVFGYISVLPGAFSAYRYKALLNGPNGKGPLDSYFKGETMHGDGPNKAGLFGELRSLSLARLCFEIVTKKKEGWVLKYVKSAKASTDVPTTIAEFISQRRRWLNGSLFAALHATVYMLRIWTSGQGFFRKIILQFEFIYNAIQLFFSWTSLANFYLAFFFLVQSATSSNDGAFSFMGVNGIGPIIFEVLLKLYIAILFVVTVCSLGNRPQGSKYTYGMAIIMFGICNVIALWCAAYTVYLQAPKSAQEWSQFGHHDVSWGTKGDNGSSKDLGGAKKVANKEGHDVFEAREDVDRVWAASKAALRNKPQEEKQHRDAATKQADADRNSRTNTVLAWIGTNMLMILVFTSQAFQE
ncbi:9550_t:CDS:10, partial [Acaulospora colombiana]